MRKLSLILLAILLALAMPAALSTPASAQYMGYSISRPSRADPAVNNYLSARYDHLLQVSPRFRRYRIWKECHIITWPGLRPDCIASFDQYEPVLYWR
ncbi:MAG: hypothetical protein ACM3JG_09285 [Thiohalocapsa sp.]